MDVLTEKIAHEAAAHATSILGILGGPSTTKKAKINSMLHLALHDRRQLAPGNMYIFTEKRPHWMPRLNKILDDCIQGNDAQRQANLDAVSADARLIGVEISPVCDHAQKKLRQSKLLAGFLVSEEHKKRIKTAEFLKSIGPLYLKSKKIAEGVYMIYLNSRYGPTADPAKVGKFSAYGRFRQQVLADIQAWSAYQSARQGVMLLR